MLIELITFRLFDFKFSHEISILGAHFIQFEADDPTPSGNCWLAYALGEILMARIKMVKCTLRSPGEAPAPRFVPLREFRLWKYYMTHAHDKIVDGEEISIWVDAESYSEQPPAQARPLEPVIRVGLQYWDQSMITAAFSQRFFPLEDYDTIRDVVLEKDYQSWDQAHP